MGVTFTVENSQALGKLSRMMERAKRESPKTTEEACAHWAKNIAYYLFVRAKKAENPKDWYTSTLPNQRGWKIANLVKGVKMPSIPGSGRLHALKVLQERAKHWAFLSAGWLRVRKIVSKDGTSRLAPGHLLNGTVEVREIPQIIGHQYSVTVINTSPDANNFHRLHGITEQALEDERLDLAQYIAMKRHTTVEKILNET